MKIRNYYIIICCLFGSIGATGQISPGELTDAHAELEGMGNCTQCHDLGNRQPSSAKCLDCHEDIQSLLDANRGYHSSQEVRAKECADCHSEHHGKNFDMMRFDEDNFDHDLTTYTLEGQHAVIECRECHQPEFILDEEIAGREGTFLGLVEDCKVCHEDFHQGTIANNEDCASCHDIEAFRPAPFFDHDDTEYPLRGRHIEVDCIECHPITTRNGKEFQEFADIAFNDCIACHEDVHNEQLPGDCMQCHEVESFTSFIGQQAFDHDQTDFILKGKHQDVSCFECHDQTSEPLLVFQDQNGIGQQDCISCHEDVHEGRFGTNCIDCHNEESWLMTGAPEDFNHDLTDYPLVGMHQEVDCKECHNTEKFTDPLAFDNCFDCHEDYHEGEFVMAGIMTDCIECHALEAGFEETTFTVERHQDSEFQLEGAHIATPCFACHLSEEPEHWTFREIGADCVDCHEDIHKGQFIVDGLNDCARCHDAETWFPTLFDHDNTAFALDGRHAEVECAACHKPTEEEGESFVEYKIPNFECVDCHSL